MNPRTTAMLGGLIGILLLVGLWVVVLSGTRGDPSEADTAESAADTAENALRSARGLLAAGEGDGSEDGDESPEQGISAEFAETLPLAPVWEDDKAADEWMLMEVPDRLSVLDLSSGDWSAEGPTPSAEGTFVSFSATVTPRQMSYPQALAFFGWLQAERPSGLVLDRFAWDLQTATIGSATNSCAGSASSYKEQSSLPPQPDLLELPIPDSAVARPGASDASSDIRVLTQEAQEEEIAPASRPNRLGAGSCITITDLGITFYYRMEPPPQDEPETEDEGNVAEESASTGSAADGG